MIEPVVFDGAQYALILRGRELLAQPMNSSDVSFLTSSEANLQLGYMRHPVGKVIDAHIHTDVERRTTGTQEALVMLKGAMRADFYSLDRSYLGSRVVRSGDVILLMHGGHGFSVLDEAVFLVVKQGPHVGAADKIRFQRANAA